jgi:hypothetical protein
MPKERSRPVVSEMQVVTRAATTAAALLGIDDHALAEILGLQEASVQRMQCLDHLLEKGSEPFERALLLIGVFRNLHAMGVGEEEAARSWLGRHNHALGAVPASMIRTRTGLVDVLDYLMGCAAAEDSSGLPPA